MKRRRNAGPGPTKPKPDECRTMNVVRAGKLFFGLGRDASYAAAKSGEMPVVKIGGRYRALVPAIERLLEGDRKPAA